MLLVGALVGGGASVAYAGEATSARTITRLAPAAAPTEIAVPDLQAYVVAPTTLADGTLSFLGNTPAQNPNGYEFPGQGFRVYISPAFAGPGTYTATVQKVGPGFDAAYPDGTKLVGGASTTQTLVVSPMLATPDTTKPVVSSDLADGTVIKTSTYLPATVTVTATDDTALAKIVANLYKDGALYKPAQTAASGTAGSIPVSTTGLPVGSYELRYNAVDAAGNMSLTERKFFTVVDDVRPVVTVQLPNAVCGSTISASFSDDQALGVVAINLYSKADDKLVKTLARKDAAGAKTDTLTADLTGLVNGEYYVKAGAFDQSGNNGTTVSTVFALDCGQAIVIPGGGSGSGVTPGGVVPAGTATGQLLPASLTSLASTGSDLSGALLAGLALLAAGGAALTWLRFRRPAMG